MSNRWYCPMWPCCDPVADPVPWGGLSFATEAAYLRHVERGHFIAAVNAPSAYVVTRMARYEEAS